MMKKNVMLMALMMMSTIIFAQRTHGGDPSAMADKRTDKMKTELGLNDDQYKRVKALNQKFAESSRKLRADTTQSVGSAKNQMTKLRTDQQAELKAILTADQWTKYTALKAKRSDGHKHGRHDKG